MKRTRNNVELLDRYYRRHKPKTICGLVESVAVSVMLEMPDIIDQEGASPVFAALRFGKDAESEAVIFFTRLPNPARPSAQHVMDRQVFRHLTPDRPVK